MTVDGRNIGGQHYLMEIVDDIAIVLLGFSVSVLQRSWQDDSLRASPGLSGIQFIPRKHSKHAVIAAIVDGLHHGAAPFAPMVGKVCKLLPAMEIHKSSRVVQQHEGKPDCAALRAGPGLLWAHPVS